MYKMLSEKCFSYITIIKTHTCKEWNVVNVEPADLVVNVDTC